MGPWAALADLGSEQTQAPGIWAGQEGLRARAHQDRAGAPLGPADGPGLARCPEPKEQHHPTMSPPTMPQAWRVGGSHRTRAGLRAPGWSLVCPRLPAGLVSLAVHAVWGGVQELPRRTATGTDGTSFSLVQGPAPAGAAQSPARAPHSSTGAWQAAHQCPLGFIRGAYDFSRA